MTSLDRLNSGWIVGVGFYCAMYHPQITYDVDGYHIWHLLVGGKSANFGILHQMGVGGGSANDKSDNVWTSPFDGHI